MVNENNIQILSDSSLKPMDIKIGIGIPVFNEEETIKLHLQNLFDVIKILPIYHFFVFIIDDGSVDSTVKCAREVKVSQPNIDFSIVSLSYNVGHQRAIFQGLLYAKQQEFDYLIIMDGDGEDDPKALPELLRKLDSDIVFVARGKRKEGVFFIIFYKIYQLLFSIITGNRMSFGNYSIISRTVIRTAAENGFVHYSAYLSKLKFSKDKIIFDRAKRLAGNSKMNLSSLVHHGFKSLVEYAEQTLFTLFKLFLTTLILVVAVVGIIFYKKFISHEAIIGWTSNMLLGLLTLSITTFGFFILGVFLLNLSFKSNESNKKRIFEVNSPTNEK